MKRMTQEQFNEWVNLKNGEFGRSHYTDIVCGGGRTVVVISENGNKFGKATCHEDDNFSRRTGIAIAYARAIGQEVPEVVSEVKVDTLSYGDKFMCFNHKYIFVAEHPTKTNQYIAVLEENGLVHNFPWFRMVEKV